MYVLELVDWTLLARLTRLIRHVHPCASRVQVLLIDQASDQVCVRLEIKLLLSIIVDGCHGGLAHPLRADVLRASDLLLHAARVVVLHFLDPITEKKSVRLSLENEERKVTYTPVLRLMVLAACPVSFSKGSGR